MDEEIIVDHDVRMRVEVRDMENPEVGDPSNPEPVWSWKREQSFREINARINVYVRYPIISDILAVLSAIDAGAVYQQFLRSCFGHFMNFNPNVSSCNVALHALLAHEIIHPDVPEDVLWFCIGDQRVRFSKYEFALVTGLRFGDSTFRPHATHTLPSDGIYNIYYGGEQKVRVITLWDDFVRGKFSASGADALKTAKVLLLYLMFFGVDEKRTSVDSWVWALVEDNDQWESFPWGKYTFQILLHYLRRIPVRLLARDDSTPGYHIYGFSIAFLVWAYEAIPILGNACGDKVSDDALPRCLRWRFPRKAVDIDRILDQQMVCAKTLSPSKEEEQSSYWSHINDDLFSGVQYMPKNDPFKRSKTTTSTSNTEVHAPRPRRSKGTREGRRKRRRLGSSARGVGMETAQVSTDDAHQTGDAHDATIDATYGERDPNPSLATEVLRDVAHVEPQVETMHDEPPVEPRDEAMRVEPRVAGDDSLLSKLIEGVHSIIKTEMDRAIKTMEERLSSIIQKELSVFLTQQGTPEGHAGTHAANMGDYTYRDFESPAARATSSVPLAARSSPSAKETTGSQPEVSAAAPSSGTTHDPPTRSSPPSVEATVDMPKGPAAAQSITTHDRQAPTSPPEMAIIDSPSPSPDRAIDLVDADTSMATAPNKEKELHATISKLTYKNKVVSARCASYESQLVDLESENKKIKEQLIASDQKYLGARAAGYAEGIEKFPSTEQGQAFLQKFWEDEKAKWLKSIEFLDHLTEGALQYFDYGFDSCQKQAEKQGFVGRVNKDVALQQVPLLKVWECSDPPE